MLKLQPSAPRGVYPGEFLKAVFLGNHPNTWFEATGEFRKPKAGEFYLSGALVSAWYARNDLDSAYWIARKVILKPDEIVHNGRVYAPKVKS